jgi:hypothetical protein
MHHGGVGQDVALYQSMYDSSYSSLSLIVTAGLVLLLLYA